MLQKLTAEQRREAARQFTFEEENLRGAVLGGKKRTRLMKVSPSHYAMPLLLHDIATCPAVLQFCLGHVIATSDGQITFCQCLERLCLFRQSLNCSMDGNMADLGAMSKSCFLDT